MKHKLQKIPGLSAFTHYLRTGLRLRIKAPLGGALLLGLLLLNTTAAQAFLVKVETHWQSPNNSNAFLDTTAFLEVTSFTGIGTELISVTSFDLVFGDLRPEISDTFLTAELSSLNEVFIHFINGAVSTYSATPNTGLDPGNTSFVINPSLGRLSRNFPLVGQANYTLQSGSVVTLPIPACDIQISQAVYFDGDTLTADVFRLANLSSAAIALEWKVWLGVPGIPAISVINVGSDGSFVLPAGADFDYGPLPLLPVTAEIPRGNYELSCRMLDPVTGDLLAEDLNNFDIQ